jgi:excisionase family DNA binding protein
MNKVAALFADYRQRTADDVSAAILTLAAVLIGESAEETPLTVRQAAERLNVSPDSIYDLCESGKLPCQRIGRGRGTIRIRATDLQAVGSPRVIKLREIA